MLNEIEFQMIKSEFGIFACLITLQYFLVQFFCKYFLLSYKLLLSNKKCLFFFLVWFLFFRVSVRSCGNEAVQRCNIVGFSLAASVERNFSLIFFFIIPAEFLILNWVKIEKIEKRKWVINMD